MESSVRMRRALLACGGISAFVYVAADAVAALSWEGYSYLDQTVSELFAIGAPTRFIILPAFTA